MIITKNCKQEEIKEGDIISYKRGDTVVTHRVYRVVNDAGNIYYVTKGDSNFIQDDYKVKFQDDSLKDQYDRYISNAKKQLEK